MSELFDWLIHIPEYLAQFGNWLMTPLEGLGWTPLAILGASAGVAVVAIIGRRRSIPREIPGITMIPKIGNIEAKALENKPKTAL